MAKGRAGCSKCSFSRTMMRREESVVRFQTSLVSHGGLFAHLYTCHSPEEGIAHIFPQLH